MVGRLAPVPPLQAFLVSAVIAIIGVTTAVRSDQSGARKVALVSAMVLVLLASGPVAAGFAHFLPRKGASGGSAGSPNSSSFCPDFLNLWDGPQGVGSAIMAVQEADNAKEFRAHGWSNTALQTAAKNAQTLAAEAPSDQLKTDFTNIAQTLSAHANLDLTYHGTGNESDEINSSTLTAKCRVEGAFGR